MTVSLTADDGLHILLPHAKDSKLLHVTGSDFVLAVNPHTTYRFAADAASIEVLVDGKPLTTVKRVAP